MREAPRVHDIAVLQEVVASLNLEVDLDEMQTRVIQGVCTVLEAEAASLILRDEDSGALVSRRTLDASGVWSSGVALLDQPSLAYECLNRGSLLSVQDLSAEARYIPELDAWPNIPARTLIMAPLSVEGKIVGLLEVLNKRAGAFDDYDCDMLSMIANLVAQAIYGKRLVQQLKVANADLAASHWELLNSRNTLRALFDSMPAALYIVNLNYKLMAINMSCAQRTGAAPRQLVGRQCFEALYGRSQACPGCRVHETFLSGRSTNRSERRPGIEDEPAEWEINTYPILGEGEQVVQAILLEQDFTERRRLENTLAQSEKLAAVGQLAASVAHEINNPLTAIIANAQILQRDLAGDPDSQDSIDLILRAGARATQVVRNLLDFARKEHYHLAPTDINETIRRALALVQHELLAHSITLSFEPDETLPLISASQDQLQGVWLNLLMNAIDAIEKEEGVLRVVTGLTKDQKRVEVWAAVIDNGKGVPSERLARIFEPFYTTKAPGRGTGLGLSVCNRVIKQHGGRIEIRSRLGEGSEFRVFLPVTPKS